MRSKPGMFRSEDEFVRWLRARVRVAVKGVRVGIGDDAAIVRTSRGTELILKTDMSIEGVHFAAALHPARAVGHRALARPLSDVAAMGGVPRFALASLAVSRSTSRWWIEEFFAGFNRLARRFGVAIVGGDTAITNGPMFVDVALVGEIKRGEALLQSGARPGDLTYVSGRLGLSRLGLETLQWKSIAKHRAKRARPIGWEAGELGQACQAHLYPEPRLALGQFLAQNHLASAMIDVSDGLSTDLGNLIRASRVGARIWASQIPRPIPVGQGDRAAPAALKRGAAAKAPTHVASLELALDGGEDYELLFTVPPRFRKRIPEDYHEIPLHRIGEIRRGRGMTIVNWDGSETPFRPGGYDHFSEGRR